jgi:hypothetical protein
MTGRPSTVSAAVAMTTLILSSSVARAQPDRRAVAHVDSASVRFPSILFSARYGGTAHVVATIDSNGRLVRESVRTESSHDLFANAAKAAVEAGRRQRSIDTREAD